MPKPITEQQAEVAAAQTQDETVPVRQPKPAKAKKAPAKAVKAVGVPAAKAKPATKKAAKTKDKPDRSMNETPPHERKIALVKALRAAGATKATKAVPTDGLVQALGYTKFDVYGLCRGTSGKADSNPRCLVATGHVAVADIEGQGICFYLTPAGAKSKFNDVPFVAGRAKAE